MTKTTLIALALSGALAIPATAGGMADPVMTMEPVEIMAAAAPSSSSAELLVPLILLALIAAAMSSSGSDTVALE